MLLDDGRNGIDDTVRSSPVVGRDGKPEQINQAYVLGIGREFADWVVLNSIARGYRVNNGVAAVTPKQQPPKVSSKGNVSSKAVSSN
jgi:hypothetical protein